MHELSVTRELIDIAVEKAREAEAKQITRINLVLGEKAGVDADCIQFYFDYMSVDSIASGATLSFKRIPLSVLCRKCGATFSPDELLWQCPDCGKWDAEITGGREFYIDSIEVD